MNASTKLTLAFLTIMPPYYHFLLMQSFGQIAIKSINYRDLKEDQILL